PSSLYTLSLHDALPICEGALLPERECRGHHGDDVHPLGHFGEVRARLGQRGAAPHDECEGGEQDPASCCHVHFSFCSGTLPAGEIPAESVGVGAPPGTCARSVSSLVCSMRRSLTCALPAR